MPQTNVEAISIATPFYGNVQSQIPCSGWAAGWIRISRTVGQITYQDGCWNASCPGSSCSCIGTTARGWNDVPMGEIFTISISRCYNGTLIDVPLSFNYVGNNRYDIYGVDLSDGSIDNIGFVRFVATPPPTTDCDQYSCEDNTLTIPSLSNVKQVDYNSTFPDDPCLNIHRLAGTVPVARSDVFLEEFEISACFNRQTQKWKFDVFNDILQPRIIVSICEDNITQKSILIADSIDGVSQVYPCTQIVEDINNFFNYGWWEQDRYLFRQLLLEHEKLHVQSYSNEIQKVQNDFDTEYLDRLNNFTCEIFSDVNQAEDYARDEIVNLSWKWSMRAALNDPIFGFRSDRPNRSTLEDLERQLHERMYGIITAWWIEAISNCNNN